MFRELVHLVGRTGNDHEAIRIAIRRLRKVSLALQYVEESNDPALWRELLSHVVQSPVMIGDFLECVGDRYDPAVFLRSIPTPNRVVISNLGSKVQNLFAERRNSLNISRSVCNAATQDTFAMVKKCKVAERRGIHSPKYGYCAICRNALLSSSQVITGCGHRFHAPCFEGKVVKFRQARLLRHREIKEATFAQGMFTTKRSCGVTDISDLFPIDVLSNIFSFCWHASSWGIFLVSKKWFQLFNEFKKTRKYVAYQGFVYPRPLETGTLRTGFFRLRSEDDEFCPLCDR
jgi:hypothetical protein